MMDYTAQELKRICDENGIEYDAKMGKPKLLKLLESNGVKGFEAKTAPDVQTKGAAEAAVREWNALKNELANYQVDTQEQKERVRKVYQDRSNSIKVELSKLNAEDELLKILRFEYTRNLIPKQHVYKLNEMEAARCDKLCEVYKTPKASGMHMEIGARYPFFQTWDETRQSNMYTFFVTVTKAPEDQISKELGWKISQGFMPEKSDYAPPKTMYMRFTLRQSEFDKYLKEVDSEMSAIL